MSEPGIRLSAEPDLGIDDYGTLLDAAGLGAKRPIFDPDRLWTMLANANLIVTARADGVLVGMARALTDFAYCCYVSELAVHRDHRRHGIGRALVAEVRRHAGPEASLFLHTLPGSERFCEEMGMTPISNVWMLPRRYG